MTGKHYFLTPSGETGWRASVDDFPDGAIELAPGQHNEVITAKIAGREALVIEDDLVIRDPAPSPQHAWEGGEWVAPEIPEPEPIDPLTLTLTKRQVNAALILAGYTDPDAFVESAVDTIADPTQKALALNDWRFAPYFQRSHPLLNDEDVLAAASLTPEQVDGLWAVASTLPA